MLSEMLNDQEHFKQKYQDAASTYEKRSIDREKELLRDLITVRTELNDYKERNEAMEIQVPRASLDCANSSSIVLLKRWSVNRA